MKVQGLEERDRRRPLTPSGTNLVGLVEHMTWIEGRYLCELFDRARPRLAWEQDLDAEWGHHSHLYATPEEATDDLVIAYRATSAAADRTIEELGLDAMGRHWSGAAVSLREMVLRVLVDRARHAGHSDILRESIDGATGGDKVSADGLRSCRPGARRTTGARVRAGGGSRVRVRCGPRCRPAPRRAW